MSSLGTGVSMSSYDSSLGQQFSTYFASGEQTKTYCLILNSQFVTSFNSGVEMVTLDSSGYFRTYGLSVSFSGVQMTSYRTYVLTARRRAAIF